MMLHPFLAGIHRADRKLARHLHEDAMPGGMNTQEAFVLSYLSAYSPSQIGRLREAFSIHPSTLTSLFARLEKRGLVQRRVHPRDRRSFLVQLTEEGWYAAERVHERLAAIEQDVLSITSEEEVEGFNAVLNALNQVLDQVDKQ